MIVAELETDTLSNLCINIDAVLQRLSEYDISPRSGLRFSIIDISERFTIWASNIGAKQKSSVPTSLQFRVREAPKLGRLFHGRLQDLYQDLGDREYLSESGCAEYIIGSMDITHTLQWQRLSMSILFQHSKKHHLPALPLHMTKTNGRRNQIL